MAGPRYATNHNSRSMVDFDTTRFHRDISDVQRRLRTIDTEVKRNISKGLINFAEYILTESLKITPIYQKANDPRQRNINTSGHLRASARVAYDLRNNRSTLIDNSNGRLRRVSFNSLPISQQDQLLQVFITYSAVYAHYMHKGKVLKGPAGHKTPTERDLRYTEPRAKKLFLQTTLEKDYRKLLQEVRRILDQM